MTYFSSIIFLQNHAKVLVNLAKRVDLEIINVQRPILSVKCGLFNPISINLIKESIFIGDRCYRLDCTTDCENSVL